MSVAVDGSLSAYGLCAVVPLLRNGSGSYYGEVRATLDVWCGGRMRGRSENGASMDALVASFVE